MSARDDLWKLIAKHAAIGGTDMAAVVDGLIEAGYTKPEPSVPVEYQWGTSPFEDGTGIMMHRSEDFAVWLRERRGAYIYRRPVPAEWELVQP